MAERSTRTVDRRRALAAAGAGLALAATPGARAEVGRRFDWTDITLVDGRVLRAQDLRSQNVVVELWATWCPFCKKQNPHLQALHEQVGGKGLTVLTFATDQDPQLIRDYLKKYRYTFAAAQWVPRVHNPWFGKRRGLPELYVVDRSGTIVVDEPGEMFPEDVAALARFARAA